MVQESEMQVPTQSSVPGNEMRQGQFGMLEGLTATHRCMRIAEIISLIAAELWCQHALKTLVSFSLTCHTICGPALDELWREGVDLADLVRVLPEDVLAERGKRTSVVRAPSELAWGRFDRYARCISSAKWWNHDKPWLPRTISDVLPKFSVDWASLLRYYPGNQPLPRLRSLRCNIEPDATHSRLLLLPPLQELDLSYMCEPNLLVMLQATLPCAPVLQVLDAHTWPANRNVDHLEHIASISRPLLHMRALVRLWISAISLEAMEHLAFLPSLENLSCCVRMLGREQTSTKLQYPSLKHATLGVHWDELSEFTRMLDRMVAPRLNILTIEYFVPRALSRAERRALPSTSHLDALCAALATFTALVSLDVDLGDDGEFPHMWRHDACLNGTALSRLFVLRNLRSLVMMPIPFDLRPHDIEAIAAAWPEMQSLRVGDMAPGLEQRTESLLRVDDLLPIALHCTQLTMLGLPLRIPAQYDDDPIPGPVDSVCPLRSLHAGEQGVTFSVRDAAVLTTFFPGVIMEDYSEIDSRDIEALRMTVLIETMTLLVRRERERRA